MKLTSPDAIQHLDEHWPTIRNGLIRLGEVLGEEVGDRLANNITGPFDDMFVKPAVKKTINSFVMDFLVTLEANRKS